MAEQHKLQGAQARHEECPWRFHPLRRPFLLVALALNLALTLSLSFPLATRAAPLSNWSWRFPQPQGCTLRAITYGGGKFVAVGDHGTIITSTDGYSWTSANSGTTARLTGVAGAFTSSDGNYQYAAVGSAGLILVSSNATTWTPLPLLTSQNLSAIAGNESWHFNHLPQFLAVGDNGTCLYSDGSTWSALNSGTTNNLYAATLAGTQIVMAGQAGTFLRLTTSGIGAVPPGTLGTTNTLLAAASNGGSTIAVAGDLGVNPIYQPGPYYNSILFSTSSGSYWNNEQWFLGRDASNPGNTNLWRLSEFFVLTGMTYGPHGFVAVGNTGSFEEYHPSVVMVSPNGSTWTELPPTVCEDPLGAVACGNDLYVGVGDFGSIAVSTDATNWTAVNPDRRGMLSAIACGTNLSLAAALPVPTTWSRSDARVLISTAGGPWSVAGNATNSPIMSDLTCDGNLFVGVGWGGSTYTTTNGRDFKLNIVSTNTLLGVRYLESRFYGVGDHGTILSSAGGSQWVDRTRYSTGYLSGVAYGNGTYVAAGSVCATSQNGLGWSLSPVPPPAPIIRLVFGRGIFAAVATSTNRGYFASQGQILTSLDGTSWASQFLEPNQDSLAGIVYSAGIFAAVSGLSGTVYTSTDGTNWLASGARIPESPGLSQYYIPTFPGCYTAIAEHNGTFFIGGPECMLLQSDPVIFTGSAARLFAAPGDNGSLNLHYTQQNGVPYRLQSSADMVHWLDLFSGAGSGQPASFPVPATPASPARFFRLVTP